MNGIFARSAVLACLLSPMALLQGLPPQGTLEGRYHFVLLETTDDGPPSTVRNLSGELNVGPDGGYTFLGRRAENAATQTSVSGTGWYEVDRMGAVRLSSPLSTAVVLDCKISADGLVLMGVDSTSGNSTWSLFVALRKGDSTVRPQGDYALATLGFSSATDYHAAALQWNDVSNGWIAEVSATGRERGGVLRDDRLGQGAFTVDASGVGNASFAATSPFLAASNRVFVSPDGAYLLGVPDGPTRGILIGIRSDVKSAAALKGRYWVAEFNLLAGRLNAASGALLPDGPSVVLLAERLRLGTRVIDFTGMNFYDLSGGTGRGWFANRVVEGVENMAVGVADADGRASAMVASQLAPFEYGVAGASDSDDLGIFFAVTAPSFEPTDELMIDPAGVVNGASFALQPNPIAEGSIVSIFGGGFVGPDVIAEATALPLPFDLEGVSVTVNGRPAPLFFVSERQINIQVPMGLAEDTATVTVHSGGRSSHPARARMGPSSPGVFSVITPESFYSGIVIHADGSLVTGADPALRGETVVIFATGLGQTEPSVESGRAYPAEPVPSLTDPSIAVYFGGQPGTVRYAGGTPGFAGLQQVNVTIPSNAPIGLNVPVAIATSNAFHDQTDIPVSGGPVLTQTRSVSVSATRRSIPPRARTAGRR